MCVTLCPGGSVGCVLHYALEGVWGGCDIIPGRECGVCV